jgi:hypothetical protein
MAEEVCGQKTFTEVEDRPVVRERVERIVEHRPVEKQVCMFTDCPIANIDPVSLRTENFKSQVLARLCIM